MRSKQQCDSEVSGSRCKHDQNHHIAPEYLCSLNRTPQMKHVRWSLGQQYRRNGLLPEKQTSMKQAQVKICSPLPPAFWVVLHHLHKNPLVCRCIIRTDTSRHLQTVIGGNQINPYQALIFSIIFIASWKFLHARHRYSIPMD